MHNIIVITHSGNVKDEISICKDLFLAGLKKLHVRKPSWDKEKISDWLKGFTSEELSKMSIHHHQDLSGKFGLGGSHISFSEKLTSQKDQDKTISCSVHNWQEARIASQTFDYIFISPLFDSISKRDYSKNPELSLMPFDLKSKKIYALGGIDENNISDAFAIGYYGVAVLGHVWSDSKNAVRNFKSLNQFANV